MSCVLAPTLQLSREGRNPSAPRAETWQLVSLLGEPNGRGGQRQPTGPVLAQPLAAFAAARGSSAPALAGVRAGGEMPTTPPSFGRCSSIHPGWDFGEGAAGLRGH